MHVESSDPAPFHPEYSVQFPPQFRSELIALARRCITRCVRFPLVLCFLRVPVHTRPFCSPPALCLRSLPHLPCVFICFHSLFPASALRSPACSFPSSPCVQSIFVCIPTPYVSAASPCALIHTVFHISSLLPLSRDTNQLVTCICHVQFGCSGHPYTHISHSRFPVVSY